MVCKLLCSRRPNVRYDGRSIALLPPVLLFASPASCLPLSCLHLPACLLPLACIFLSCLPLLLTLFYSSPSLHPQFPFISSISNPAPFLLTFPLLLSPSCPASLALSFSLHPPFISSSLSYAIPPFPEFPS